MQYLGSVRTAAVLVMVLLGHGGQAAAQPMGDGLKLQAGTYQLGGEASFTVDRGFNYTAGEDQLGFELYLAPSFGYFVLDYLALSLDIGFDKYFGERYEGYGTSMDFAAGVTYYVDMGMFVPYVGVRGGFSQYTPSGGEASNSLKARLRGGVLLPVSTNVAIDLALSLNYTMQMGEGGHSSFNIPLGYFGVRAFI